MVADLDSWIACIRDQNAETFEAAYHGPRPTGPDVLPRLLAEMRRSTDGYTRGKFMELLGEMGDDSVVPDLVAELSHADQNVRQWAVTALEHIGGEEAAQAVRKYKADRPEEFA